MKSILEAARFPFKDCVALALETGDPYMDFRISMEEIVEACELNDQEHLEELLAMARKRKEKLKENITITYSGNSLAQATRWTKFELSDMD